MTRSMQREIIAILKKNPRPMSVARLAELLGVERNDKGLWGYIYLLLHNGEIVREGKSWLVNLPH